jgi:hypothetical protein
MKRFQFIVAAVLWFIFGTLAFAAPIEGVLEVSWDISWEDIPWDSCQDKCEPNREIHARFYPDNIPSQISISSWAAEMKHNKEEIREAYKSFSQNLASKKKIVISFLSIKQDYLVKLSSSVQGIQESFLRHRERFWRVRAKVDFPKGIQASPFCDNWEFWADDVIIVETDKTALDASNDGISGLTGCSSSGNYDELFTIKPTNDKTKISIWSAADKNSTVLVILKPGADVLKLESVGDGKTWMKVSSMRIIGYIYLPDVILEPVN